MNETLELVAEPIMQKDPMHDPEVVADLAKKDLRLCAVCLQWTCEGPHCHVEGVCPD